jgi:hypothetical protein
LLENLLSNENQNGSMNERGGSAMNDPNRTTAAPKVGQQSQSTAPKTGKGATQQGGSDNKSGQQSQGVSQMDTDGMKQAGSSSAANDPKNPAEAGPKSGSPK